MDRDDAVLLLLLWRRDDWGFGFRLGLRSSNGDGEEEEEEEKEEEEVVGGGVEKEESGRSVPQASQQR